ncbi:right-handed parallel beta-helix repeat-containing protein [Sphingomonas abietis]|uniref:Right-handed parallel beta-helix repeat-containing protein n=1 Tax=Sphingomonas abietis TaxID=3012344 RepID=A0ABY7NSL7_9SPHN|nr:right-handed parallel beta-helix repeat-containing protein [Sphingomonas abietis]WBO23572.1 right-handed parallel beta-helix repeat-containing protein [Sphingomonas abietis]
MKMLFPFMATALGLTMTLATAGQAQQAPQAQPAAMPFVVQESGKGFYRLDDAVRSVNGGDATIVIAPGTYKDCAKVDQGRVAFRAKVSGSAIFDGGICDGKATLVLSGTDAMVDGLVFQNLKVPDGNGAGIRLQHGNLTVMNSTFRNSEEGILAGDDATGEIHVDRSSFSGLGSCAVASGCAHGLYIGHYGKLYVTRSRFEKGRGGHYLKSRAAWVSITDNSFDDSQGHGTNYTIDLCSGATGTIARNIMSSGPDKENHSGFIVVAAEQRDNPSAGLTIVDNTATLTPGVTYTPTFVIDFSHEPLVINGNMLGHGINRFETR